MRKAPLHSKCASVGFLTIRSFPRKGVKEGFSHCESKHLNDCANPQLGTLLPLILLLVYFGMTDIRHGQRSSSRRRRRNRETKKKKKRQKHKTSKKAVDTLDIHTGHIFRPLAASFSSSSSFFSSSSLYNSSSTSSIVSTQHFTSQGKSAHRLRADCSYSTDEGKTNHPQLQPLFPAVTMNETSNAHP
ncbi:hypothetical protein ALC53_02775 [Atta colombica]|uniref:Uncharacterized protein n=1 Tax=Atta colombica TaxID=520822 RepID=A0A195BQ78_9HYME|nr:hypothetical protein ALC53_02775 [Atta colombica]